MFQQKSPSRKFLQKQKYSVWNRKFLFETENFCQNRKFLFETENFCQNRKFLFKTENFCQNRKVDEKALSRKMHESGWENQNARRKLIKEMWTILNGAVDHDALLLTKTRVYVLYKVFIIILHPKKGGIKDDE